MEIVNPLSAADPPEAPVTVTPVKLNWNPPTASSLFIAISNVPPEELTFDNERLYPSCTHSFGSVTSPSHVPQASRSASPPHSPAQSSTAEPPHSPAQSSTAEPPHSPAQSSTAEPPHSPAQSSTAEPPHSPAQSSIAEPSQTPAQSKTPLAQSSPPPSDDAPSKYPKSKALPEGSDITIPDKPVPGPLVSSSNNTPHPEEIVPPVNENPKTVVEEVLIKKPAVAASPPEASFTVVPSTLNWKPPMSDEEL